MKVSLAQASWKKSYNWLGAIFLTILFLFIQSGRLEILPWDDALSWRQSDTYSMAQNFVWFNMNPLQPQLNYDGVADNYAQLELQIMPFLSALIFRLTGVMDPAVCRVLCLIFFLGSAAFLYLLLRDFAGAAPALFGYGVYLFLPLSLLMASSIQPEACALFFYCGGVYFLRCFQLSGKYRFLAAASAMTAVAIMERTPVAFVGLLFLYVLWDIMGKGFYKNPWFYACGVITSSMLEKLHSIGQPQACVIASRYQSGAGVQGLTKDRQWLSGLAKLYYSMLLQVPNVRDYTCGYRLYTRQALVQAWEKYQEHLIERQGFACMMELLYKLYKSGCLFAEIPFRLYYDDKEGDSKMRVAKTIRDSLLTALELRLFS